MHKKKNKKNCKQLYMTGPFKIYGHKYDVQFARLGWHSFALTPLSPKHKASQLQKTTTKQTWNNWCKMVEAKEND